MAVVLIAVFGYTAGLLAVILAAAVLKFLIHEVRHPSA